MGKIISIHSFRGGTGKSNVTANLAAQIAMKGKRVAIVDTDIQSPGIHVLFGLDESTMGYTLNDYLYGNCPMQQVAYQVGKQIKSDESGRSQLLNKSIWLIPSSIKSREISKVLRDGYEVSVLNRGLKILRKDLKLDYLFIDTHPGLNEETLLSVAISDELIIVLRPDQQDFQGTAVTIDIAKGLDVPKMRLVVNKALTKYSFHDIHEQVEDIFKIPVAAVLPLSEDLADLGSRDLFSLCHPEHEWSKGVLEISRSILDQGL